MNLVNRIELSTITGWATSTIDKRTKSGMPYVAKPDRALGIKEWQYDTVAIIAWVGEASAPDAMKDANLRDKVASATIKELDIAERLRELISSDAMQEIDEEANAVVKSRLLAIPGRMAQPLSVESDPVVILRMLNDEIAQVLEQLNVDYSKLLEVE